jgi:RNA polymerase sigma-70 factor (ECF subfamily)
MDATLANLLACDRDRGFEELVRAYQHRLFAYCLVLTGHHDEADDVAQDTFLRAYRAFGRYPPERIRELPLQPWLHKIALNLVRNRVRDRHAFRRKHDAEAREAAIRGPVTARATEDEAESRRVMRELGSLIAKLPPSQRDALVLRWVQDLSYVQAAEVLDRPVNTVKSDVHRGMAALRESIKNHDRGIEL